MRFRFFVWLVTMKAMRALTRYAAVGIEESGLGLSPAERIAPKLFFYFDTEGLRLSIPQVFFVTIPSPQFEAAAMAHLDSIFGASSASDAFYKNIFDLYNAMPGAGADTSGGQHTPDLAGAWSEARFDQNVQDLATSGFEPVLPP